MLVGGFDARTERRRLLPAQRHHVSVAPEDADISVLDQTVTELGLGFLIQR
jgi:hypothetical protein